MSTFTIKVATKYLPITAPYTIGAGMNANKLTKRYPRPIANDLSSGGTHLLIHSSIIVESTPDITITQIVPKSNDHVADTAG